MTEHHDLPDALDALRGLVADLDMEIHPAPGYEGLTPAHYVVIVGPEDHRSNGTRTAIEQRATAAHITAKVDAWRAEAEQAAEFFATTRPPGLPAERVARRGAIFGDYQSERARLETELAKLDAEHARTAARLDSEDTVVLLGLRNQALEEAFLKDADAAAREEAAEVTRAAAERVDRLTADAAARDLLLHKATIPKFDDDGTVDRADAVWTLRGRATQPDIRQHLTGGSHVDVGGRVLPNPPAGTHFSTGGYELPWAGPDLDSIEWFLDATNPTTPTSG